ncbi:transposase [Streptomyces chartreusis]
MTRSGSARTRSPGAPGAPRGQPRSSAAQGTGLRERDVRDQHPRPDALHGLHRDLRREGHVPLPRPPRGALRPEGAPDRGPHSAHRSKAVRVWLADHKDEIELHFLPSYSPELNPDELVNADLKRSLPHTHRARNQTELATETRRFDEPRRGVLPVRAEGAASVPGTGSRPELTVSR